MKACKITSICEHHRRKMDCCPPRISHVQMCILRIEGSFSRNLGC